MALAMPIDHDHGHGLSDRPPHAQHDRSAYSGPGRGEHHPPDGLPTGGAQRQRALPVGPGHRLDAVFADADDGRQYHGRQDDDSGGQAQSRTADLPDQGNDEHQAHQAVDHRRECPPAAPPPAAGSGESGAGPRRPAERRSPGPAVWRLMRAPMVTSTVPTIMTRMPYDGLASPTGFGSHFVPRRKSSRPISPKAGTASLRMNTAMARSMAIETVAQTSRAPWEVRSIRYRFLILSRSPPERRHPAGALLPGSP